MVDDPSIETYRNLVHLIIDYKDDLVSRNVTTYMALNLEVTKACELHKINMTQASDLREKIRKRWDGNYE